MSARLSLLEMLPAQTVPTDLGLLPPKSTFKFLHCLESEDEDEEDEEDNRTKEELELESENQPLPESPNTLRSSSVLPSFHQDHDAFDPNWRNQDMEYTSLAFGKKTAFFVYATQAHHMRGKRSRRPKLGRKYILAVFLQDGHIKWGLKLIRDRCFCGVVQRGGLNHDFDSLKLAVGAGYIVEAHVVSTSLSKTPGTGERILVGRFTWKITGKKTLDSEYTGV